MIKTRNIMGREMLNMRRLASFKPDSQNRELSVLHLFVILHSLEPHKRIPKTVRVLEISSTQVASGQPWQYV